jgi:hypothetical protein
VHLDSATVPRFRRVRKAVGGGFLADPSSDTSGVATCRA